MDIKLIKRIYDEKLITDTVMTMIGDVIEDGTSHDCFELDVYRDCWLETNGALFHITAHNRTTLDIHCYIPKKLRVKSKEYGLMALDWIKNSAPKMYSKIISTAPSIYRHVAIYLLSVGFKKEGCLTDAFTKNGELWDLNYYGLKRCDI